MKAAASAVIDCLEGSSAASMAAACRSAIGACTALQALKGFGSARVGRGLRGFAARPEIVRACQSLVVGDPLTPPSLVAVLVLEGGVESIDALLQFRQAEPTEKRCRELASLVPATSDIAKLLGRGVLERARVAARPFAGRGELRVASL